MRSKMIAAVAVGFLMLSAPSFANLTNDVYEDTARMAVLDTPRGQYNAGVSLLRTVQNYEAAAKWFEKAAKGGHAKAQAVLGSMYAIGSGLEKDHVLAYVWLHTSMPNLEGDMLDSTISLWDELVSSMSSDDISEALEIINAWKTQSMDR